MNDKQENSQEFTEHIPGKVTLLFSILVREPSEMFRIAGVAWNTFIYCYVKRCIGKGSVVGGNLTIINSSNVKFGKNCLLQDSVYIRAGREGKVVAGDGVAFNSFVKIFGHGTVEIGDNTQLGPGTLLTTTGHAYDTGMKVNYKKIVIGKGVWVGANVTILQDVEIGDFSVIGAGAVVNKSIPPNSIAAGVPARVIKAIHRK